MKPLTIELVKCQKRELQSLGWKTPKAGERRLQLYALKESAKPLVLTLSPALPSFWLPGYPVVLTCEPFPEAVCIEISPCRLLPPPCYQSREEFEGQLPGNYVFDPWHAVYWGTHHEVLFLEPSDDGPLQERLDKWLTAMRAAYEREASAWRERIKRLMTATLKELGFDTEEQRAKQVAELRAQLDIVESENPIDGVPCKGHLKLTLADVKRGHEGIRNAWMHEDWAMKNGEDLEIMTRERRVFRKWLVNHTGTPANIFNATTRQSHQGIEPPVLLERFENNPQFLEACAKVRHRARFADKAGTVVYLADCELPREELDAVELDEVATIRGAPANAEAAIQKAAMEIAKKLSAPLGPIGNHHNKPDCGARYENDFSVAVIYQRKGEPLRLTIEPELRSLVKRIIAAGGNIPRIELRKDKTDTFQPEKLLRSKTAKSLLKAGLLGCQRTGRTTVFWAKIQVN